MFILKTLHNEGRRDVQKGRPRSEETLYKLYFLK